MNGNDDMDAGQQQQRPQPHLQPEPVEQHQEQQRHKRARYDSPEDSTTTAIDRAELDTFAMSHHSTAAAQPQIPQDLQQVQQEQQ
ncbi:hypothetical protein NX059_000797 [Plenodomus lindquistii]|nr:hypothetical protein NX059_000797 [Plenodomus lindquistii]